MTPKSYVMPKSSILIVFDLDDTLYPELDFVKSGFRNLASQLTPNTSEITYDILWNLFLEDSKAVIDRYLAKYQSRLSKEQLISAYRFHKPQLTLDPIVKEIIEDLSGQGPLALITDGAAQMQHQKFEALGLTPYFKLTIFSDEFGTSKPDPILYKKVMDTFPEYSKFAYIADNPKKDFITPQALKWTSIRIKSPNGIYRQIPFEGKYEMTSIAYLKSVLKTL